MALAPENSLNSLAASPAKSVSDLHNNSDLDSGSLAQHHTLGEGNHQAAPGALTASRIVSLQDGIDALIIDVGTLQSDVITLTNDVGLLVLADSALDGRLDILEADLVATDAVAGGNQTGGATVGSWVSGANLPGNVFTAPISGAVTIDTSGYIRSLVDGQGMLLDVEVREGNTIGAGTVVRAASANTCAANYNIQFIRGHSIVFLEGLTPGAEYNVKGFYFQTVGTGHLINNSYMQIAMR